MKKRCDVAVRKRGGRESGGEETEGKQLGKEKAGV